MRLGNKIVMEKGEIRISNRVGVASDGGCE